MQKVPAVNLLRLNIPKGNFLTVQGTTTIPILFIQGPLLPPAATVLSVMTQTFDWHLY